MNEIWKDIKGYEGLYQISNTGKVKSLERLVPTKIKGTFQKIKEKIRKTTLTTAGYEYVVLSKNGKNKTLLVHRLVAETFLDNPENKKCVNHKDENKSNNNVYNLEWCDYEYNNTYKNIHLRRNTDNITRKVIQYDLDMNEIKRWNTIIEAAKTYNAASGNIIKCCKGERTHCCGFKWRYYE